MKIDGEFLKKNPFWVLVVPVLILTLVAYIVLQFPVSAAIAEKQNDVESKLKSVKNTSNVKSQQWVEAASERAKLEKSKETKVWEAAWYGQNDLFTWPKALEQKFGFSDGNFAATIIAERSAAGAENQQAVPSQSPSGEAPAEGESIAEPTEFEGVIVSLDRDTLKAKGFWVGTQQKQPKEEIFFRTATREKEEAVPEWSKLPDNYGKVLITEGGQQREAVFQNLQPGDRVKISVQRGKYFGDPLTDSEIRLYHQSYRSQLDDLLRIVEPVRPNGTGVVQLGTWRYVEGELPPPGSPFFTYVAADWKDGRANSKEAWTAQEDLWVQREIFELVKRANDYVAECNEFTPEVKGDHIYGFYNPYWRLDFKLSGPSLNKLEVKIQNLQPTMQRLDVSFDLWLRKEKESQPFRITLQGEPLDPYGSSNDSRKFERPLTPGAATGIYRVRQILNWETAAVKVVQQVVFGAGPSGATSNVNRGGPGVGPLGKSMGGGPQGSTAGPGGGGGTTSSAAVGAHSHRTMVKGLSEFFQDATELAKAQDSTQQGQGDAKNPMMGAMGGAQGSTASGSPNGLQFKRYSEITEQARRLPVAVVLIVDQRHVGIVQAAFANSKLRFLTTQVLLNRYPKSVQPVVELADAKPGGASGFSFGKFGGFPGMRGGYYGGQAAGYRAGMSSPPPGRNLGTGSGGSAAPGATSDDGLGGPYRGGGAYSPFGGLTQVPEETGTSNVELVLYGIVSLYHRYPPRTAGTASTTP